MQRIYKFTLLLSFWFLVAYWASGQIPALQWAKNFGGDQYSFSRNITVDGNGNVFASGVFSGTNDFDPGVGVVSRTAVGGYYDAYVSKFDAAGNLLWVVTFGGTFNEGIGSVTTSPAGEVYVVGSFNNTVDFDPGAGVSNLVSAGLADIFILKLTTSGALVWVKRIGGVNSDDAVSITLDHAGNFLILGHYNGLVDFDPGAGVQTLPGTATYNMFVLKLDASGNFVWVKSFYGGLTTYARALAIDLSNNVIITGTFGQSVDFDPGILS